MGIQLSKLVEQKEIRLDDLKDRVLVVDSMNMLYQFLTTLRMADGTPLSDEKGNITAHLVGILSRVTGLVEKGIKLVFVFDGAAPLLKKEERERRQKVKEDATEKYEIAKERGDIAEMRKYAQMTTKIDKKVIDDSKRLLDLLGFPIIQAPSEGEAQCAHIVKRGDADFVVSQDFDVFLFGAPKVVRNLTLSQYKKKGQKGTEITRVDLTDVLKSLEITNEQLIILGILVGTDFNRGGIKGIGPMKGLKLVKEYKDRYDALFSELNWKDNFDFSWKEVYEIFDNIPVTDNYSIKWKRIDEEGLRTFLIGERNFSEERVNSAIEKISKGNPKNQKRLADFFG